MRSTAYFGHLKLTVKRVNIMPKESKTQSKSQDEKAINETPQHYLIADLEEDAEWLIAFAQQKPTKVEGTKAAVALIIDAIETALKVHTFAVVAEELSKRSIKITGGTLKQYVSRIRKEKVSVSEPSSEQPLEPLVEPSSSEPQKTERVLPSASLKLKGESKTKKDEPQIEQSDEINDQATDKSAIELPSDLLKEVIG